MNLRKRRKRLWLWVKCQVVQYLWQHARHRLRAPLVKHALQEPATRLQSIGQKLLKRPCSSLEVAAGAGYA